MTSSGINWKQRAYQGYVSSGQSSAVTDAEKHFAGRKPYILSVIQTHIPTDRQQVIVDLGCGSGAYLYFLQQHNYPHVQGVDVSAEQVAQAHAVGLTNVVCQSIEEYAASLPDACADVILLMDVLEHLSRQEIFDLLDQVWRILKPEGRCLLHVPNAEGLFGMRIRYGDITHELAFTPRSIHQICSLIGFENVQCFEDKPLLYSLKSCVRRLIWDVSTLYARLLLMAETGQRQFVLSQNMLVSARRRSR